MNKKIIFSSYDSVHNPFYGGGGARAIEEITKRLAENFSVVVFTGNYKGAKDYQKDNVAYRHIGPAFAGPKAGMLFFHLLLPYYVRKEHFDLWIESFTPPFSTSCLQLFTRKPVIGVMHMLSSEDMERKYKLPFHLIEEQGLKTYKYFVLLSDIFKKKIQRVNKTAEILCIPNGVTAQPLQEKKSNRSEPYILFLGRLEIDQKGIDVLIESYQTIAKKTSAKLVIAGFGSAREETKLKNLIKQHKLSNQVMFVGRVEDKKKERLLQEATLVVIPSRFETFGMVALEAMAYGKPIVSFAIEGLHWIPDQCIIRVKKFDKEQFGEAMLSLLGDAKKRQQIGDTARIASIQYAWEEIVTQYKQMFQKIFAYEK